MAKKSIDLALSDAVKRSLKAYQKQPSSIPQLGKPNAASAFLTYPDNILKKFIDKFEENTQMKSQITDCIPTKFQKNSSGYRVNNNCLSLLVNNAAIATQLRFIKTEVLNKLRHSGLWSLSNINIKVDPNSKTGV